MSAFASFPIYLAKYKDAESFLQTYHQELLRLRDFPDTEGAALDFPVEDRDVACQTDTFPPGLLALLGNLRIMLATSRYPIPQIICHPDSFYLLLAAAFNFSICCRWPEPCPPILSTRSATVISRCSSG